MLHVIVTAAHANEGLPTYPRGHGRGLAGALATSSSTGMPAASRGRDTYVTSTCATARSRRTTTRPNWTWRRAIAWRCWASRAPGCMRAMRRVAAWMDSGREDAHCDGLEACPRGTCHAGNPPDLPCQFSRLASGKVDKDKGARMLGSRSGYVRRVEDIAGDGAGLAVGADWRVGGAVGARGPSRLGCAAGFDIPPICARRWKPSDTATGISVLYGSDLAAGRRSSALRARAGRGAASVAGGHGPDRAGGRRQGFSLRLAPSAIRRARCRRRRGIAGAFEAQLQQRVLDAPCRQPASAPGVYRAALALRVDRQGQIGSVRLLDSTGSAARDAAIRAALQGLAGGRAVRRSGQGLRGAGVAAREPQAGGLRQRAPACSATERE